jgi:hypothetical protein
MSNREQEQAFLEEFETSDSTEIVIKNQKGDDDLIVDGEKVKVEIWASGSKEGQRALKKSGIAWAARQARLMRGDLDKRDADQAETERVTKLVGFTKSISKNWKASAEATYANTKLGWFTRQIEACIGEDKLFTKAPSESSAST